MARVTVEDCVDKVPNRFDLVMLAAHRAREISSGSEITVPRDNDKNPVVALREIADETLSAANLHEAAVQSYQTQIEVDEPEEDEMALLMGGADDEPDDGMNDAGAEIDRPAINLPWSIFFCPCWPISWLPEMSNKK